MGYAGRARWWVVPGVARGRRPRAAPHSGRRRGGGAGPALLLVAATVLPAGCGALAPPPPWARTIGYRPGEVLRIEIRRDGRPEVPVTLDGQRMRLLFDTGNMIGLFLSPRLAARLRLPVVGAWTSEDASGAVLGRARVFGVGQVVAFGRSWQDERAFERSEPRLDGAIGPRYLTGGRYTLDGRRRRMAASFAPGPPPRARDTLALLEAPCCPGMPVVRGAVNGSPVLIQLDTGKTRTCVDPTLAAALGLPAAPSGYRIDAIRLGALTFAVADAKPVSFHGISDGLPEPILLGVGSDLLGQTVLSVDYRRGTVSLSR